MHTLRYNLYNSIIIIFNYCGLCLLGLSITIIVFRIIITLNYLLELTTCYWDTEIRDFKADSHNSRFERLEW